MAVCLAAGFAGTQGTTQPNAPATIVYHFERVGLPVPVYTITLHEDGTGTYAGTRMAVPIGNNPAEVQEPNSSISGTISVSPVTTAKVFEEIRTTGHLAHCDTKLKNVADSGTKTLDYTGSDGHAACTYNYTESKPIVAITEIFQGIQEMLEFGARLEHEHRYDRLGLDAEMQKLVNEIKEKRAVEVLTIAPTLKSIAEDSQVIERVRVQAAKLLAMR